MRLKCLLSGESVDVLGHPLELFGRKLGGGWINTGASCCVEGSLLIGCNSRTGWRKLRMTSCRVELAMSGVYTRMLDRHHGMITTDG